MRLCDIQKVGINMNRDGTGNLVKDSNDWFFEGKKLTDEEKKKVFEKMNNL